VTVTVRRLAAAQLAGRRASAARPPAPVPWSPRLQEAPQLREVARLPEAARLLEAARPTRDVLVRVDEPVVAESRQPAAWEKRTESLPLQPPLVEAAAGTQSAPARPPMESLSQVSPTRIVAPVRPGLKAPGP
jgi:hypothetical protein